MRNPRRSPEETSGPHGEVRWMKWRGRRHLRRTLFWWFGVVLAAGGGAASWATQHFPGVSKWKVVALLFVLLWVLSGLLARRLARPIDELSRAASLLGRGRFDARVDVTRMRRGEARVLAVAFNQMAGRIEKQMADQRALLAMVSHELRTPLSRIRLLTEAARGAATWDPERASPLSEIDKEVEGLDALVGDLLASSRLDFATTERKPLRAVEIATRALEEAHCDATLLDVEGAFLLFEGDATLAVRAIANLLDNAVRHGKGVRALKVHEHEGYVRFDVFDHGEGPAPGEEEKVFEPFYRGTGAGHGLGLSLVRRIALSHGGFTHAARTSEGGRFSICFPRALR